MVEGTSDVTIEARLLEFLSAERRRAEDDYPHLLLRRSGARSASAPIGLAALAAVVVAATVLIRPWSLLPTMPGADPLGADGIPLSIAGQPVLRGTEIDNRLSDPTSFLAGGYLVVHQETCASASPTPTVGCGEDWRLEEAAGEHSIRVTTVAGGATVVRTSGAATVFLVKPVDGSEALLVEAVPWRQPTKGRIPPAAMPPEGGDINMALVPDFVGVWGGPTGETIVGYAPKDLLLIPDSAVSGTPEDPPQSEPIPVYGEDLTTLVGHMVADHGFVPLGSSPPPTAPIVVTAASPEPGAVSLSHPPADAARAFELCSVRGWVEAKGIDVIRGIGRIDHADEAFHYARLTGNEPELQSDKPAWIVQFRGDIRMAMSNIVYVDPVCIVVDGGDGGFFTTGTVREVGSGVVRTPQPVPMEPDRALPPPQP
jgi:hypothetical protein